MSDADGDGLAEALLGRHVRGSADGPVDLRQPGQRSRAAQDRDAEVQHLHQAAVDDHHVGGLDVAVHDVDPVHVGEHRRDLRRDRRRPGHGRRRRCVVRLVEQRLQRRAAQQLHDQPQLRGAVRRVFHAGVVDGGGARDAPAGR